jgi:hypothetical protein
VADLALRLALRLPGGLDLQVGTAGERTAVARLRVVVSDALPIPPSPGADARRIVRHGMADVLEWLGEKVGPKPGEHTHAIVSGGNLHVSAHLAQAMLKRAEGPRV